MRRKRPYTEPGRIKERIKAGHEVMANKRLIMVIPDISIKDIMHSNTLGPEFKVAACKYRMAKSPKKWCQS